MKNLSGFILSLTILFSCDRPAKDNSARSKLIVGTWKLLKGTLIEKGDTVVTDYTNGREFIKIINDTHFAFLGHDFNRSDSAFSAGGGYYSLQDSLYTEHLVFCNDRQWEGNEFSFIVTISNDTLIQQGTERIDSIGVNRINIEKYARVKGK